MRIEVDRNWLKVLWSASDNFIVYGKDPIIPRDIRRLQLAMILSGKNFKTLEDADEALERLENLEDSDAGKLMKYFSIFERKNMEIPHEFSPEILQVLQKVGAVEKVSDYRVICDHKFTQV